MILLFSSTIFLSAFLLFSMQPMVGKMLLPIFGGSPGVWTTCMVFFQTAYLCGNLLTLALTRKLKLRAQLTVYSLCF